MSRAVQARLSRLEAAAPAPGRVIAMFMWRKTDAEILAEQADMVRRGLASPGDNFQSLRGWTLSTLATGQLPERVKGWPYPGRAFPPFSSPVP